MISYNNNNTKIMGNELNSISKCNKCGCTQSTSEKMKHDGNSNCPSCGHKWDDHFD